MYGIDYIEITIRQNDITQDIVINLKDKNALCNNQKFTIEEDNIRNLFSVLRRAGVSNNRSTIIDGENCIVNLYEGNLIVDTILYNSESKDYLLFKNIIGEICKI